MALKTRKPTGQGLWPRILLEGEEKSGRSWMPAELSASDKVGRTVVLVLGEDVSKWDNFGRIPGARFEIIEHGGSWSEIISAAEDAKEEAAKALADGQPPMVFVFDTVSAEWDGLKDWAGWRARNTKRAKELLAQNPNVEIEISGNFWNDARARHRRLMGHLLTFPGIVVLIARGNEVTLYRDGKPVAGQKDWSVESEKGMAFDVSAHVRMRRSAPALLISTAGVGSPVPPGADPLVLERGWTLESLIFGTLQLDTAQASAGGVIEMQTSETTPEQILDEARRPETTFARIKELRELVFDLRYDELVMPNERRQDELLTAQLVRIGHDKKRAEQEQAEERAAAKDPGTVKAEALRALAANDMWIDPINELGSLAAEEALRASFLETFASKPASDPRVRALTALLDLRRAELLAAAGSAQAQEPAQSELATA